MSLVYVEYDRIAAEADYQPLPFRDQMQDHHMRVLQPQNQSLPIQDGQHFSGFGNGL